MKFFGIKDSIDEIRYSYGAAEKAKSAAKILGIAVANTAIFAGKTVVAVGQAAEEKKKRMEK